MVTSTELMEQIRRNLLGDLGDVPVRLPNLRRPGPVVAGEMIFSRIPPDLFKVETEAGRVVAVFPTKAQAKACRDGFVERRGKRVVHHAFVRRGPGHPKGETGKTPYRPVLMAQPGLISGFRSGRTI